MRKCNYRFVSNDEGIETRSEMFDTFSKAYDSLLEEVVNDCRDFYDGDRKSYNKDVESGLLAYKIESWGSGELDGCRIAAYNFSPRIDENGDVKFV